MVQYKIHNTARDVTTKTQRVTASRRPRMNLTLSGGDLRVPRGRHIVVSEDVFRRLQNELIEKKRCGGLKVTDMNNREIDPETMEVVNLPLPAPPLPRAPETGAAFDQTFEHGVGIPIPQYAGRKAETEVLARPNVFDHTEEEDTSDGAGEEEEVDLAAQEQARQAAEEAELMKELERQEAEMKRLAEEAQLRQAEEDARLEALKVQQEVSAWPAPKVEEIVPPVLSTDKPPSEPALEVQDSELEPVVDPVPPASPTVESAPDTRETSKKKPNKSGR